MNERCIETWRKVLPDWRIMLWDDKNAPDIPFVQKAIRRRPILASNFVKYWALAEHGGVFLDNDVEILRPFELDHGAFVGFQRDEVEDDCVNSAVIASVKGHGLMNEMVEEIGRQSMDIFPVWCGCTLLTQKLRERGMHGLNVEQKVGDVMVYSKERFYPWRWDEAADSTRITDRTLAVHWWEGSWRAHR
jgi:mannosyltransferase OCH1-like enzyme